LFGLGFVSSSSSTFFAVAALWLTAEGLLFPPLCVQARERNKQDSATARSGKAAAVGWTHVFNWMYKAACVHKTEGVRRLPPS
jgi:hypothetical protein